MAVVRSGYKAPARQANIDFISKQYGEEVLTWPCVREYIAKVEAYENIWEQGHKALGREDVDLATRRSITGDFVRYTSEIIQLWETLLWCLENGRQEMVTRRKARESARVATWERHNQEDLKSGQRWRSTEFLDRPAKTIPATRPIVPSGKERA